MGAGGASVGTCWARAALAGNPSDGYGGAVVAVPVTSVAATVTATPAERFELVPSPTGDDTFDDLGALVDHVDRVGYDGARRLVLATIRALVRCGAEPAPARVEVRTTIPRSVGLAGSSAIVVALIRALGAASPSDGSRGTVEVGGVTLDPDRVAEVALAVEVDELGVAAGLQDRLVQSHGVALAMDFDPGAARRSRPLDLPAGAELVVAVRPAAAEPSGAVHGDLRRRWASGDAGVRDVMARLADAGRRAADAIDAGDVAALGAAMDDTLDRRAELVELDADLLAAAHDVRQLGAHANWSGSGGALTVLVPTGVDSAAVGRRLATVHGCGLLAT